MGNWIASLFSRLNPKKDFKILMVGLDNAGKTTILYKVNNTLLSNDELSNSIFVLAAHWRCSGIDSYSWL